MFYLSFHVTFIIIHPQISVAIKSIKAIKSDKLNKPREMNVATAFLAFYASFSASRF